MHQVLSLGPDRLSADDDLAAPTKLYRRSVIHPRSARVEPPFPIASAVNHPPQPHCRDGSPLAHRDPTRNQAGTPPRYAYARASCIAYACALCMRLMHTSCTPATHVIHSLCMRLMHAPYAYTSCMRLMHVMHAPHACAPCTPRSTSTAPDRFTSPAAAADSVSHMAYSHNARWTAPAAAVSCHTCSGPPQDSDTTDCSDPLFEGPPGCGVTPARPGWSRPFDSVCIEPPASIAPALLNHPPRPHLPPALQGAGTAVLHRPAAQPVRPVRHAVGRLLAALRPRRRPTAGALPTPARARVEPTLFRHRCRCSSVRHCQCRNHWQSTCPNHWQSTATTESDSVGTTAAPLLAPHLR